jgi:hypothetical protein
MILHQNIDLFEDYINYTAEKMSINPALVEKDYWISWDLRAIFKSEIGEDEELSIWLFSKSK